MQKAKVLVLAYNLGSGSWLT